MSDYITTFSKVKFSEKALKSVFRNRREITDFYL